MSRLPIYRLYAGARLHKRHLLSLCLITLILGFHGISSAEGTKQLEPQSAPSKSVCKLVLSQNYPDFRIPFALLGCSSEYRLNIRISDYATEKIYLGFGNTVDYFDESIIFTDVNYQLRDPAGKVVNGYSLSMLPRVQGSAGFIGTRSQVDAGPNINNTNPGGYTPLEIDPQMNGDYVIEFQIPDSPQNTLRIFKYIDVTVARGNTPIPGRLWSKAWQLGSGSVSADESASYSLFYIYTNDSIVTRFDCNGLAGGVWSVYSNQWGCSNTGAWSDRRRSIVGNTTVRPEYMIFLNDPDPAVFPSGHIGEMIDFKILKEECDTVITFATHVSKGGNIEIMLDAPPLNPGDIGPEDVQLGYNVSAGYNVLLPAWDGKNRFGVPIANGTEVSARISFLNGLSNIPLYDVEDNPKGFKVDIQRPLPVSGNTKLKLYWDDTELAQKYFPTSNVTDGCVYPGFDPVSGCHDWTRMQGLGDTNTINSWWYLTTDQVLDVPITLKIRPSSGSITGPLNICDGQEVSFRTSAISFARKYIWHVSGSGVGFNFETDVPDTTFTYEFPISWPQGNYTVSVFGRNPQCFDGEEVSFSSIVHNPPEAAFTYTNPCLGAGIIFTDQTIASDTILNQFTWTVNSVTGDKHTLQGNPALFVFDTVANYQMSHMVTDLLGCSDTITSWIPIRPRPESSFEYTENPNHNGELHFENLTSGASEYSWDFGNGISSTLTEPVIQYNLEGDYAIRLLAINLDGCIDTAVRHYYYMPGFWIPNAFSPNNDGNNEIFRPVTQRTTLDPYQFLIYSRWGELIFETSNPDVGWDGTLNGKPCDAGSYTYFVQYREAKIEGSEIVKRRGMVSLIR